MTALAVYCDRCGGELAAGGHDSCVPLRELEPPRYCAYCKRRMKVQVTPLAWRAECSVHGVVEPGR